MNKIVVSTEYKLGVSKLLCTVATLARKDAVSTIAFREKLAPEDVVINHFNDNYTPFSRQAEGA